MKDKVTHCNWLDMNCDFIVLVLSGMQFILASPAAKSRPACYMFCFCFLLSIFNNFCQINYLKIYPMNLRQIYRVGRIMAVDDQPEISFLIVRGRCHDNQILFFRGWVSLDAGTSGEAGRANAGLCPASSLLSVLILIVFVRNASSISSITVCNCRLWFRRSSWESFSFARCSHCFFTLVGCKAVSVFVCPSACVSQKSHFWTLRELLFMLPTTVTRFCSENSAILLCASGLITGCLSPVIPALPGLEVGQYETVCHTGTFLDG